MRRHTNWSLSGKFRMLFALAFLLFDYNPFGLSRDDSARFRSGSSEVALSWLLAFPTEDAFRLSNETVKMGVRLLMGLDIPQALVPKTCECNEESDAQGDHFFRCKLGPEKIRRHDALARTFEKIVRECHGHTKPEVFLRDLGLDDPQNGLRLDLLVHCTAFERPVLVDVSVAHPTQKAFVASSAKFDGFTASQIETHKNQKYRQKIVEGGYIFYPLVAETYGRWGHSMDEFLATGKMCLPLRRSLLEAA
eukprot:Platyproteum_vivax@DN7202_c0_g1_i1.p1